MTRGLATLALALVVVSAPMAARQSRDASRPVAASGRVSGTVVNAESGRPVRFARVLIEGPNGGADDVTGEDGTFAIERLPPGSYQLIVTKPGYLETAYGQARPGTATPGKRMTLADREHIERLVVPLSQGGSISGVVRDDRGDPAYGAEVRVLRWAMKNGLRTLEIVQSAATDERGKYRVSLLPARDYLVSVAPGPDSVPGSTRRPATQAFAPVFYQGTLRARTASLVSIGPGEERSDVDVQLPLVGLGSVTGVVLGLDGRPAQGVAVSLMDQEHEGLEELVQTDGLGRFLFERVAPGTYVVTAGARSGVFVSRAARKGHVVIEIAEPEAPARSAPAGTASGDVTVVSGGASDVVLTLEPARTVAGRIVWEGSSRPPSLRGAVVELTSRSLAGEQVETKVAEDGTFAIANVPPGRYTVAFAGEAPPWILASAISNGADALDFLLDVPRDRDVRDLVLTLRDKAAELVGAATDAAGRPAVDRTAVVFPADERLWVAGDRRVRAQPLSLDGTFVFENLRPGAYLLAMTDSVEADEWLNPDFLRRLAAAAVPVTIGQGEKKVQDLRIR